MIERYLQPGEYAVGDAHVRMRTLLGSCVSITLWHRAARIGAMSHFLLPTRGDGRQSAPLDARYGVDALRLMLAALRRRRLDPQQCEARIFGGGNMFPGHVGTRGGNVGRRNGEAAREMLLAAGIDVVSEELFGVGHRQLAFDIATGQVWSRQVAPESVMGTL